jgi:uncharacterized DUF497 family protein
VRFVWDPKKARTNARKHGVTFVEADDGVHPDRAIITGVSAGRRILVTVFVELGEHETRLISARAATRKERKHHEQGKEA